jgi:hypothetical protein
MALEQRRNLESASIIGPRMGKEDTQTTEVHWRLNSVQQERYACFEDFKRKKPETAQVTDESADSKRDHEAGLR